MAAVISKIMRQSAFPNRYPSTPLDRRLLAIAQLVSKLSVNVSLSKSAIGAVHPHVRLKASGNYDDFSDDLDVI